MFSAAVRVLARAATIQLEEAAAAHPRPPRTLLKGKERAIPIRRDVRAEPVAINSDLGVKAGVEGLGGNQGDVAGGGEGGYTNEGGLEEQLGSIADELPVRADESTAGPSRQPRQTLIRESEIKPVEPIKTPKSGPEQAIHSSSSAVNDHVERAQPVEAKPEVTKNPSEKISESGPEVVPPTPIDTKSIPPTEVEPFHVEAAMPTINEPQIPLAEEAEDTPVVMRASKVPSSRIGRLFHYGSLAASMGWGAASEGLRRSAGGTASGSSVFMSDANIRRLVSTLGRMRGAALKLGQFMSIQDNHMLPPEIEQVLQQVQAHANYMPDWQMEKVMSTEFGAEWQQMFSSFERVPVASASIGQVHKATMASTGLPVAVKIQFPGIASSISSDLSNLSILLRSSALLPKGLYLQNTIAVMKRELEDECDYIREAESGRRFSALLKDYDFFRIPTVVDEASSSKVLTVEWMEGKPLSRMKGLSQEDRDRIGENILRLCLLELFEFRFMQTDPNWANFLYDPSAKKLGLIDFGASREYTKEFMDGWYRLLMSAVKGDRVTMKDESEKLGYLTGEENEMMVKAHLDSMALVASPFCHKGPYAFAQQTITSSVRSLIPVMLAHRLTPPPQETYSLNRKLSGAFLMCAKLEAHVDCSKLWEEVVGHYKQG